MYTAHEKTNHPDFVEYRQPPRLVDQIMRLVGRGVVATSATIVENSRYDGPSVNELLDEHEARGTKTVFGPSSEEARMLAASLRQGPRLSSPLFATSEMPRGNESVKIAARDEWPVSLPSRNFVWAPEMVNWVDGREHPKFTGDGTVESDQLIRDYARRSTLAPPIGTVIAHVQPNNLVVYSVALDGAHRTAAAMMRDENVLVGDTIHFERLEEDIITC